MNKKVLITLSILCATSGVFAKGVVDDIENFYMQGDYAKAYKSAVEALKTEPSDEKVHYYLALCYLKQGSLNDAKAEFRNVINISPGSKYAKLSVAGIQNIFEEQNRDFSQMSAKSSSEEKKYTPPAASSAMLEAQNTDAKKAKINLGYGSNYFFNAADITGKIIRWDAIHPINIHIPEKDYGLGDTAKEAFLVWKSAYNFKFEFVKSPVKAHIRLHLKSKLGSNTDKYDKGGYAKHDIRNGKLRKVDIYAETKNSKGEPIHPNSFYNVMVHEIGHSLGIWGHSDKAEDVMYPISMPGVRRFTLSKRDKNTMKALYKSDADITNMKKDSGVRILDKNESLHDATKETKIAEAKKYVALMPKEPSNWVNLGNTYFNFKDYKNAIDAYVTAIKMDPENKDALANCASSYYELKKYNPAIKLYKRLIVLDNKDINYYHDLALCYLKLDAVSYAKATLDECVRVNPKSQKDKKIRSLHR